MLSYPIIKVTGEIDWTALPVIPIDHVLWTEDTGIQAQGQLCYDDECLYVHQSAAEKEIRAEYTKPQSPVCEDSCLEFFFMQEGGPAYFNFEINPNGCLGIEYGPARTDRQKIILPDPISFFRIHTDRTKDGWEVFYAIPLALIRSYAPDFSFAGELRANMYKCGDKTVHKHFLSWTPIDLEKPNFHCPAYFGAMHFSA